MWYPLVILISFNLLKYCIFLIFRLHKNINLNSVFKVDGYLRPRENIFLFARHVRRNPQGARNRKKLLEMFVVKIF